MIPPGKKLLIYELPESVAAVLQPGARVRVPVRTRTALATVIELLDETDVPGVKPIAEVVSAEPILSPLLLKLGAWMADYYCCSLEAAMKAVLPNVIRKAEVGHQTRLFARRAREIEEEEIEKLRKKAPLQAAAIRFLQEAAEPVAATDLAEKSDATHSVVQALVKKGLIVTEAARVERDPFGDESFVHAAALEMNAEQLAVFERVKHAIDEDGKTVPKPILLHGVTGSGKTEIYLQAIQLVLERGQSAIMLVPEISLTPQTVERFKSRFAATKHEVAVLHSHLSEGERHDEWHKIREGRARIVIGARSAIFAPCADLGLVVVDEEHENSYKQEETPRYHGRDVAVLRASMEKCAILLGSATPSLESFHNAQTGKYELLRLLARVDDKKMPFIRVIDLRQESKKHGAILSEKLITAVSECPAGEARADHPLSQSPRLFDFAGVRKVRACLPVPELLGVGLTFSSRGGPDCLPYLRLSSGRAGMKCPECRDPGIKYTGTGTEKVEDVVSRLFPKAVVKRMDADVMQRRDAYRETLNAFRTG